MRPLRHKAEHTGGAGFEPLTLDKSVPCPLLPFSLIFVALPAKPATNLLVFVVEHHPLD